MIKVVKFGGSSLASAEQFAKVGKIIHADKERRYVVPSAPGKRNSKDTKVTDMLYACYDLVEKDEDFRVMLMKIKDRYDTIINGLNLKLSLEEEFKKISENFKNKAPVPRNITLMKVLKAPTSIITMTATAPTMWSGTKMPTVCR